ncbi:ribonuclease P protein subunit p20 [Acipenser ruthenus]|nr:ribonuclease P protein subunit p20 [Acipenser ruthenus]
MEIDRHSTVMELSALSLQKRVVGLVQGVRFVRQRVDRPVNSPGMADGGVTLAQHREIDPAEFTLRKRLPRKLPQRRNDVYVNMKTDFRAQLARCQRLLEGGEFNEICIHGLGLAINRAINIALQLQGNGLGALRLAPNTSTVELVDDLEPETDQGEPVSRTRNNSAIHIKVFRADPQ